MMNSVTLEEANIIADTALAEGRRQRASPLTVAVLDAGGHVVVLKREDGSGILRPEIATGKAWGALGFGLGSRTLAGRPEKFLAAVAAASGGRVVPVPGGVLIRDGEGNILGAAGISGDSSDLDETCAVAGIKAANLVPDTGR